MKGLVIGAGRIFLSHIPHILFNSDVEDLAIVDTNFANRYVARKLTHCKVFKSLNDVDISRVDFAVILTPPTSHFEILMHMLAKGIDCFVEKPLTLSASDTRKLVQVARSKNTLLQVGYVYGYEPLILVLRQMLTERRYGRARRAEVSLCGCVRTGNDKQGWRSSGRGAGCLYDYGSHAIDLATRLFGESLSVESASGECLHAGPVVDLFSARLVSTMDQELEIDIFCNWSDETRRKAETSISVQFDSAFFTTDLKTIRVETESGRHEDDVSSVACAVPFYLRGEAFALQWKHFFDRLKSSEASRTDDYDRLVAVDRLIETIEEKVSC